MPQKTRGASCKTLNLLHLSFINFFLSRISVAPKKFLREDFCVAHLYTTSDVTRPRDFQHLLWVALVTSNFQVGQNLYTKHSALSSFWSDSLTTIADTKLREWAKRNGADLSVIDNMVPARKYGHWKAKTRESGNNGIQCDDSLYKKL